MLKNLVLILLAVFGMISVAYAQNPKLVAWETEADTLMQRQDFAGAIKLYTRIIAETKLKEELDYGPVYKRGYAYYSSGDFKNAVADMSLFIPKFPRSFEAIIMRALSYRELGDLENQLADVESANKLNQGNPQILKWRAGLLMEKSEFKRAMADLLLVKQFQDDAEVEMNLGFAYYSLESYDSAMLSINKAIELDATYMPAYLYGGSFSLEQEDYPLAEKYLSIALRLDPENATALFYRGIALIELKKEKEGCSFLAKAFAAGQDDAGDYLKQHCYDVYK